VSVLAIGLMATALGACATRFPSEWAQGVEMVGLERKQAQGFWLTSEADEVEEAQFDILLPLSKVFYERTTNRRVNSKATFDDPALREFFHDPAAFADYYANFVEALDRAYFESHKPTAVRLLRIEKVAPKRVKIEVEFRGGNRKPMRLWSTRLTRVDEWEFAAGRWWVIPGKV